MPTTAVTAAATNKFRTCVLLIVQSPNEPICIL